MWQCVKCQTDVEDSFDACWACGTSRLGAEDPSFTPVVDQSEPAMGPKGRATITTAPDAISYAVAGADMRPRGGVDDLALLGDCVLDAIRTMR